MLLLLLACQPPETDPTDTAPTCVAPDGEPTLDRWGGDTRVALTASGLFHTEKLCDRWWLVTPEGHPTWSIGVNTVTPWGATEQGTGRQPYAEAVTANYPDHEAWAVAAAARLRSWGFNTAASWSDDALLAPHIAVTPNLALSGGDWQSGEVADWWDPTWSEFVRARVEERVRPRVGDPAVIGWFLDNEMRWGTDWRGFGSLRSVYLSLPEGAPGRAVAEEARDDDAFLALAAERFFSVTTSAIRAVDPDHLVLGSREVASMARPAVWAAAAAHVDVLSANNYVFREGVADAAMQMTGGLDPANGLAAHAAAADLPILVTEYGFRAADSGLPNTWPPIYPVYETQTDRADAFEAHFSQHLAAPWIVGMHWFQWVDQPEGGRFDGEDNNWGVVSVDDAPYEVVTARMAEVHARVGGELRVAK